MCVCVCVCVCAHMCAQISNPNIIVLVLCFKVLVHNENNYIVISGGEMLQVTNI